MTVSKTMRILTIYCLFRDCEEVEIREITDHIWRTGAMESG